MLSLEERVAQLGIGDRPLIVDLHVADQEVGVESNKARISASLASRLGIGSGSPQFIIANICWLSWLVVDVLADRLNA